MTPAPAVSLPIYDDVELMNLPPVRWLVSDRIPRGGLVAMYGPPAAGKSTLAVDIAVSVARGLPWLGAVVDDPGPVCFVAGEGVPGTRDRVKARKLLGALPLDEAVGLHVIPQAIDFASPGAVMRLHACVEHLGPRLVVLDTFARCFSGDENSAKDVGGFIAMADWLRVKADATVLVLHHSGKRGREERGSSALRAASDTMLELSTCDGLLTLTCSKQRDAEPFAPIRLRLVGTPDGPVVQPAGMLAIGRQPSDAQARLLDALATFPEGATSAAWQAAVPGVPERTFYQARLRLLDLRLVRKAGSQYFAATRPGGSR